MFTNIDHDGMLDGANREEVAQVGARGGGGQRDLLRAASAALADLRALASLRAELALDASTA